MPLKVLYPVKVRLLIKHKSSNNDKLKNTFFWYSIIKMVIGLKFWWHSAVPLQWYSYNTNLDKHDHDVAPKMAIFL